MSKPAATFASTCRMHIGWLCAALSALTLLPPTALAAVPEPSLRRSEQIDVGRIGKVSNDERSVLRVEWRAAVSGSEETRSVQAMLDSLRRMEGTIGEVRRLIQDMPARQSVVAPVMAEPPGSGGYDPRIVAASVVSALLVALWWAQRRSPLQPSKPKVAITAASAANPPPESAPVAILPARVSVAETDVSKAPAAEAALGEPPANQPKPVQIAGEKPPDAATPAIKADAAPSPTPDREPAAAPSPADSHVIDFKLEEAEPEVIARENARLEKLEAMDRRKDPERKQASHVDPTLELAEIMLSLGLEQGAAQALVDYTESNPRQALHHWLKLLDIYRNSGHRKDFKDAAEKLRQNFNIQAEDWIGANAEESPMLENFSRLSEQIQQTWSRPEECIAYLRHLLEDNREGSRAGFPRPVAEEILLLIDILKEVSGTNQTAAV